MTYAGYQMLLAGHEHSPAAEFELVQALLARGVDALVLVGGEHTPELWGVLTAWNKPALLTWSGDSRLPSVGIDNEVAAQVAAEHLLELGHQRIGVIARITADSERARSRVQGVRKALEQAGLTLPTSLFTVQEFSFEGGRSGLRILTAARAPPSAIFCGNDLLRAGALLEAPRMGLKVPQQLAICGFDDMEFASALNPGLTTIRVPVRDMGRRRAQRAFATGR